MPPSNFPSCILYPSADLSGTILMLFLPKYFFKFSIHFLSFWISYFSQSVSYSNIQSVAFYAPSNCFMAKSISSFSSMFCFHKICNNVSIWRLGFWLRPLFSLWGWSPITLRRYLETPSLNLYQCMMLPLHYPLWYAMFL